MFVLWGFQGLCFVAILVANKLTARTGSAANAAGSAALGSTAAGTAEVPDGEGVEALDVIENLLVCC